MNGIVAAFGATGLYYLGFAVFKPAADRMERLRGDRIPRMLWVILTDWVFLIGLALVLGGLGLQIVALAELSLSVAVPIFMSGVLPLLLIAMVFFGDRLTGREWLSLLLIAAAAGLITASVGSTSPITTADVPAWELAAIVGPALVVPLFVLVSGEGRPDGRHARPITGIAFGIGSGVPIGTAELSIKGWSDAGLTGGLTTLYPYTTVVAAGIGFGILMVAFQRCRVSVVAAVMTVSAKAHLLVTGTLLYGEPWPDEPRHFAMRVGALVLAAIALVQFPRHRPIAAPSSDSSGPSGFSGSSGEAAGHGTRAPARDPFSEPPVSRFSGSGPLPHPLSAPPQPVERRPARNVFDRLPGAPPDRDEPPRSASGHLAPDRDTGPHALFDPAAPARHEVPEPRRTPPKPGPYAQDPQGRGPHGRRDVFADFGDDDAYEIPEQSGTGPYGIAGPEAGTDADRRRPGR